MRKLAKPLPLDTPTTIELAPGNRIRVTLIDANHCVGAVMFLIEGNNKAILYTGDIRAETWWVNSLVQNPILLPYTLGTKALDCIYLDTTFATKSNVYREFPSKAEGIKELLRKVGSYPNRTIFYFHSWTFGYENVWVALSNFLGSRIHLDDYRAGIYGSLSTLDKKSLQASGLKVLKENVDLQQSGLEVREAPALCGFRNGNHIQPGCLTSDDKVRIHSCERGMGCTVMDHDAAEIVHIVPIVNRVGNTDILEVGAGGGNGDLSQKEELENGDAMPFKELKELCVKSIKDPEVLSKVLSLVQQELSDGNNQSNIDQDSPGSLPGTTFPDSIRFPYSRHSSYAELCTLIDAFKPKDIFPCTVDEANWNPTLSMKSLFGSYCSANVFQHDIEMINAWEAKNEQDANGKKMRETQLSTQESEVHSTTPVVFKRQKTQVSSGEKIMGAEPDTDIFYTPTAVWEQPLKSATVVEDEIEVASTSHTSRAARSFQTEEMQRQRNSRMAYNAALGFSLTWDDYGGLVCTRRKQDLAEHELEL